MADATRFNLELDKFLRDAKVEAVDFIKRVAGETFVTIVQATPVGNNTRWDVNIKRAQKGLAPVPPGYVGGQARRNWQLTVESPATTRLAGTDASGNAAQAGAFQVLATLRDAPSRLWISNPLPYMDALEHGWSKQAPTGMVANAVAAISSKYARVS